MNNVYTIKAEINCNSYEKAIEILNDLRDNYCDDIDVDNYDFTLDIKEGY